MEKEKLLIIDDEINNIILLTALLKKDYRIIKAQTGGEALKICETEKPDLVLLDLNMPNINGLEILKQLRNHPKTVDIPIYCLSADDSKTSQIQAHEMGATGFFHKPISTETFRFDLLTVLDGLNINMKSEDNRTNVNIVFNQEKKRNKAISLLKNNLPNHKIIFLSFSDPANFLDQELHQFIAADQLYYLQIKTSLYSKLPFIQDISVLIDDLSTLVSSELSSVELVFDDLDDMLNIYESVSSNFHLVRLSELVKVRFKSIHCLFKKQPNSIRQQRLFNASKLLVGAA